MSRTMLWVITAVLGLGFIGIKFVYMPGRQTPLRQNGVREHGTVQMKDSVPTAEGKMIYRVSVIFPDSQNRNHQANIVMMDEGRWNDLKPNQDVIVYYLANDPDTASIDGGDGLAAPHSSAMNFLAWSMFLAGAVAGYMAFKAPKPEKKQPQNKVTVTRH